MVHKQVGHRYLNTSIDNIIYEYKHAYCSWTVHMLLE